MMLGQAAVSAKRKSVSSVVLTEIADRRVFQRGTTSATVPISGTWAGGVEAIQARVINSTTSAEVVAWTTIAATPTGSTWSGNITVPQGGWYKIEVRRSGLSGSVKRSANRIAVGDVWLFAGQSQQARMSTLVGSPPTADDLTVYRNSNGLWQAPGEFSGTGGNGGIRFLNLMRQYTGVPQAMAQTAVEGSSITDWESGDSAFINASNRLQAIGTVKGILWHQGGTGINDLTKADYKTRLAALRANFAAAGSFGYFGVFPLMYRTDATNSDDDTQKIRQAHFEYITENASTLNLGWTPDVPMADAVHQTAAGSEVIAYAYAHALLYAMGVVSEPNIGPRITGVSRNGVTLTATILHNGGSSLKTPTGNFVTGFQVFPRGAIHSDGTSLAISAVTLGASTIAITLAADPGTAVDLYYQYGKFDNSSPVYDNTSALGRTTGNALQPLMQPVQSTVEAQPLVNPAVKLSGFDAWIRYGDSVRWTLPDADWTMGVMTSIASTAPNGAQNQSYIFSGGSYGGTNSFNFVLYETNAGTHASKLEFSVKGAGATTYYARPAVADLNAVAPGWRWWIVEYVKATQTINVYHCPVLGARTLYATVSAPSLGVVDPTTGPGLGTRVPPAANSGLYLNGSFAEFFKIDGRLSPAEVAELAEGKDIQTDLGRTTQVHTYFQSLSTPIGDASGSGPAASLNANTQDPPGLQLAEGPIFTPSASAVRFNGTDTKYTFADSPSFNLPDADWTFGVMCATTNNTGTAAQYIFSNGGYQAAHTFNLLFWEESSTNPHQVSVPMKGSGGVNIEVFASGTPTTLTDGVFRLWLVERVKATETLNIYYVNANGSRVLYGTGSTASLGAINPPGGASGLPTIGTRAVTPSGRWYVGDVYMAFQVNSLLTQTQAENLASGVDLVAGLGVSPSWYIKTNDTTPTILDGSGNGNTATLSGGASKVSGPPFSEPDSRDYLSYPFSATASPWNRVIPGTATYSALGSGWASLPWGLQTWEDPDGYSIGFYRATNSDPLFNVVFKDTWWDVNGDTGEGARGWLRQGNTLTVENTILSEAVNSFPFDMNPYSTVVATDPETQTKPPASQYKAFVNPGTLPFQVRIPSGALPAPGSDGHLVVIQPNGLIFECYGAIKVTEATPSIVCTRYMMIDPKLLGDGWDNGLTASMVSVTAGVIRKHEIDHSAGSPLIKINHAMKIAVPGNFLSTGAPLYPALTMDMSALTHSTPYNGTDALPMGVRLAIPWSVDLNSRTFLSDVGREMAIAAQRHGFIVTDRGGGGITVFNERAPTQATLTTWDSNISSDGDWIMDNLQRVTSGV